VKERSPGRGDFLAVGAIRQVDRGLSQQELSEEKGGDLSVSTCEKGVSRWKIRKDPRQEAGGTW